MGAISALSLIAFVGLLGIYVRLMCGITHQTTPDKVIQGLYIGFLLKLGIGLVAVLGIFPVVGLRNTLIFLTGLVTMNSVFLISRVK